MAFIIALAGAILFTAGIRLYAGFGTKKDAAENESPAETNRIEEKAEIIDQK